MNFTKVVLMATIVVAMAACSDNPTSVMDEEEDVVSVANTRTAKVESGPSVVTDKDDYAPGQTVTITGAGWFPGETVEMVLNENPEVCTARTLSSVADDNGNFVNTDFAPEDHDIGVEFTLVATGQTSGLTAQTVFTDGAPTVNSFTLNASASAISVALGSNITVAVNATTFDAPPAGGVNDATWKSTQIAFRNIGLGIDFGDKAICNDTDVVNPASVTTTNHSFVASTSALVAGTFDVRVRAYDGDGCSGQQGSMTKTANLTLTSATNTPPTVDANGPYSGNQGQNINIAGTANDTDGDPLTYLWTYVGPGTCTFGSATSLSTTINCNLYGSYTLTLSVTDSKSAPVTDTAALTVINQPPSADANGPYSGNEGSNISIAGTASDPENDPLTYLWTYATGAGVDAGASCSFGNANALSTTVNCTDDGSYTLTLAVNDGINSDVTDNATLTVSNVAPSVTITSPVDGALYSISQMVSVSASFTDPGSNDTHTCTFSWDDGMTTGPTAGTSPCSSSHSYSAFGAGIFNIIVTVTDDDSGIGRDTVLVIVYDPSAGFVTGGGWIMSPAGAYKPDAGLSGKANFGFVSKYKKGATIPTGNTEFQFHAGGLNFHSENYEWLVVNKGGTNAQYKGTGTINGAGSYKFMLWAGDGSPDTFRIKIWEENGGEVIVYDNGVDQAIGGGQIVIHAK